MIWEDFSTDAYLCGEMQHVVRTVQCPMFNSCLYEFHKSLELSLVYCLFIFLRFLKLQENMSGFFLKCFVVLVCGIRPISGDHYIGIKRKYIPVLTKIVKAIADNSCI